MKQIETILVGLGRIGQGYNKINKKNYLTHYKAVKNSKNFKLIACIDLKRPKLKNFHFKIFKNLKDLKLSDKPKFAIIATPSNSHLRVIQQTLKYQHSIKYILCEKPFGQNLNESNKIVNLCKKKKVKVYVNYMRRSEPGVIKSKKILGQKFKDFLIGSVFYDGTSFNQASHMINLLQFWLGKKKKVIRLDKNKKSIKNYGINFQIKFKNASIYFFGIDIKNYSYASIKLISKHGEFNYTDRGSSIFWKKSVKDKIFNENYMPNLKPMIIKNDMNNYQKHVYKEIYKDISGKKSFVSKSNDALETMKILNSI